MPETAVAEVPQTSTPAVTTSTSDSSPVTATPTTPATPASPAASTRPTDAKSLSAFMQSMDAAADATQSDQPLVVDQAAATTAPSTGDVKSGVPDPSLTQGPIPFQVHQTALKNARDKAVQEYRQSHWTSKIDQQQFEQVRGFANAYSSDPVAFYNWLGSELERHPTYSQQLRSSAGRVLAGGRNAMPEPDIIVMDGNGQATGKTYSADRMAELRQWERQQMTGEFQQLVQPLIADRDARIATERQVETQRQVAAGADQVMARIEKILDGRKELYPHMNTLMEQHPDMDALDAALQVREQHLKPIAEAAAQKTVQETHLKKAAGNTANGTGAAATTARPTDAKSLAKWMADNEARL